MIVVCGESLVDLVEVAASGPTPLLRMLPGGSPANAAVALARLGQRVALATRVGRDAGGALVRRHLESSGILDSFVVQVEEPTTLALVNLGPRGDAQYQFYFEATASWSWELTDLPAALASEVEALHIGSMALVAPKGREAITAWIRKVRSRRTVSLDPNVRTAVIRDLPEYRTALEGIIEACHLVRVSEEDLRALYPDRVVEQVAADWAGRGPRLVVVSRGAEAPLAIFEHNVVVGPRREVRVVDTVGAGDTFSAALLDHFSRAGLLRDQLRGLDAPNLGRALEFASAAASLTCERAGADPPTAAEVAERLT